MTNVVNNHIFSFLQYVADTQQNMLSKEEYA